MITNVRIKHGSFWNNGWAIFTDVFDDLNGTRAYARFPWQLSVNEALTQLKSYDRYR